MVKRPSVSEREREVLEVIKSKEPVHLTKVSAIVGQELEEVKSIATSLSRKHLVATMPGFKYEYVGDVNYPTEKEF